MIPYWSLIVILFLIPIVGLIWAYISYKKLFSDDPNGRSELEERLSISVNEGGLTKNEEMISFHKSIHDGSRAYYLQEVIFVILLSLLIGTLIKFMVDSDGDYGTTVSFGIGVFTGVLIGYLGVNIAISANFKIVIESQRSMSDGCKLASKLGFIRSIATISIVVLSLTILILIYRSTYDDISTSQATISRLYQSVCGYALGIGLVCIFGRIGGSIISDGGKSSAYLLGKSEDLISQQAYNIVSGVVNNTCETIGQTIGFGDDILLNISGSLISSLIFLANSNQRVFASSFSCTQAEIQNGLICDSADVFLFYPLIVQSFSIFTGIGSYAILSISKNAFNNRESIIQAYRKQIAISVLINAVFNGLAGLIAFEVPDGVTPSHFEVINLAVSSTPFEITFMNIFYCGCIGAFIFFFLSVISQRYTDRTTGAVEEVVHSTLTGAATNIIYGLSMGYISTVIPSVLLAISAYVSLKILGYFGVSIIAMTLTSISPLLISLNTFKVLNVNAEWIAKISEFDENSIMRTNELRSSAKEISSGCESGFISASCFTSLSLFLAFIMNAGLPPYNSTNNNPDILIIDNSITQPLIFSGLLFGAMLPYAISSFAIKAVQSVSVHSFKFMKIQILEDQKIADGAKAFSYARFFTEISSNSFKRLILILIIVVIFPILLGIVFGPQVFGGLIPGIIISSVEVAISSLNSGNVWKSAKDFIEMNKEILGEELGGPGSDTHNAAKVGSKVGHAFKNSAVASISAIVKLVPLLAIVLLPLFQDTDYSDLV